jgi:parallel beta-helix repeat protein
MPQRNRLMARHVAFAALALALAPGASSAQTCPLVVDVSGGGHFTTIQAAVSHFKASLGNLGPCTIEVRAGVYSTATNLDGVNASASAEAQRLVIQGTRGATGQFLSRLATGSSTAVNLRSSRFVTLRDFEITTQTNKPVSLDGSGKKNLHVHIVSNDFHDNGNGRDAGCVYVADDNENTWIVNNACRKNGGNAIVLGKSSVTNFVVNNTVLDNAKSGIVVAKGAKATLANNLVLFNGTSGGAQYGIQLVTGSGAQGDRRLLHNVVYGNDVGVGGDFAGRSSATADVGNQDTATLGAGLLANDFLVDPAAGNLRLVLGSPALNAGIASTSTTPERVPSVDFEAGPRDPISPDVGWDEAADADFDGQPDGADNCPPGLNSAFNPLQGDGDGDGVGNYCDNCPDVPNTNQADASGFDAFGNSTPVPNGRGDACENATSGVGESLFQVPTGPAADAIFVATFGSLGSTRTVPPDCVNTYFYCKDSSGALLPRTHVFFSRGIPDSLVTYAAGTQVTVACPLSELFPVAAFSAGTYTCKACYDNEHRDLDLTEAGACTNPPCESNFTGVVCSAEQSFTVDPDASYGGCEPDFWVNTNDPQPWLDTGLSAGADFDATFGVDRFEEDVTLFEALYQGGEPYDELARQATAGLLNASNADVHYPYAPDAVKALLVQGDPESRLSAANDLVCPFLPVID